MAHPQLDELLNTLKIASTKHLADYGEFYPFGASITNEDKPHLNMAYEGRGNPPSQVLIDMISEGFKQDIQNGKLKAVGICYDVRLKNPKDNKEDAICFSLEHKEGESLKAYLPYSKSESGEISYGSLFAETKEREFFLE